MTTSAFLNLLNLYLDNRDQINHFNQLMLICLQYIDEKNLLAFKFDILRKHLNCKMFAKLGYTEQNLAEIVEENTMKKS